MPERIGRLPPYCMRASELKWKNDLDRHQFEFNQQILDSLRLTLKSLEQGATSQAVMLVESSIKDLLQRQKLVRFADRSIGGWATAYEYNKDDLADNSADEHRIGSAESCVQKQKKNTGSTKPSSFFGFAGQNEKERLSPNNRTKVEKVKIQSKENSEISSEESDPKNRRQVASSTDNNPRKTKT
uniref:Uncharacterized protein n=1 Tax=Romanomermis culicivorax TaxID=13658 RepID=A0A915KEU4_ROMCU